MPKVTKAATRPTVNVELTPEEADMLDTILYGVAWDGSRIGQFAQDLSYAFSDKTETSLIPATYQMDGDGFMEIIEGTTED